LQHCLSPAVVTMVGRITSAIVASRLQHLDRLFD
jgi:hypothetical protein